MVIVRSLFRNGKLAALQGTCQPNMMRDKLGRKFTEENVLRSLIGASLSLAALTALMPLTVQAAPADFCRE
jgi:hypothetical protein